MGSGLSWSFSGSFEFGLKKFFLIKCVSTTHPIDTLTYRFYWIYIWILCSRQSDENESYSPVSLIFPNNYESLNCNFIVVYQLLSIDSGLDFGIWFVGYCLSFVKHSELFHYYNQAEIWPKYQNYSSLSVCCIHVFQLDIAVSG